MIEAVDILIAAIKPDENCCCEDGSRTLDKGGNAVPTCAFHGSRTWWVVREARRVVKALRAEESRKEQERRDEIDNARAHDALA